MVIDQVRYETVPEGVGAGGSKSGRTDTFMRIIPPPREEGGDVSPIIGLPTKAQDLPGKIQPVDQGPIEFEAHGCDGYVDGHRTWPYVEMLTMITTGAGGAVINQMNIDYHVGTDNYTQAFGSWKIGICGNSVPRGLGCGKPKV